MKRVLPLIAALIFLITGCTTMNQLYPALPVEQQFCTLHPAAVLCKVSAQSGFTLEQWNDVLLDATLLPVAANEIDGNQVYEILNEIVAKLEDPASQFSTNGLLQWVVYKYDLNPAAAMLVKRRLDRLAVPVVGDMILDRDSVAFILDSLKGQRDQFALFYKPKTNH